MRPRSPRHGALGGTPHPVRFRPFNVRLLTLTMVAHPPSSSSPLPVLARGIFALLGAVRCRRALFVQTEAVEQSRVLRGVGSVRTVGNQLLRRLARCGHVGSVRTVGKRAVPRSARCGQAGHLLRHRRGLSALRRPADGSSGSNRAPLLQFVALSGVAAPRLSRSDQPPNPSLQPTGYGVPPPPAAELKR